MDGILEDRILPVRVHTCFTLVKIRRPCLALAEAGRRLGPPQVWNFAFGNRPKQHRSHPAMPPQCPATPRTADIWLPKATDSTSGLKTLAAPQPARSSNGASVASHAQDPAMAPPWPASSFRKLRMALTRFAAPQPAQSSSSNGASSRQPGPGQQFYGFRKRRMAPRPLKTSPRPKATDGTSALKTLAAPQPAQSSSSNGASVASQAQDSSYMASESDGWHLGLENPMASESDGWHLGLHTLRRESDGWHLGLENPRRASAGPVFVQQWRLRGQPSPGQQLYGF